MAYHPLLVVIVVVINQQDTPPISSSPYTRNYYNSLQATRATNHQNQTKTARLCEANTGSITMARSTRP